MKIIRQSRLAGILIFILMFSFLIIQNEVFTEERTIDSTFHPVFFDRDKKRVTVLGEGATGSNYVSEATYIGNSKIFTVWLRCFNNTGSTHAKLDYDLSVDYDRQGSPSQDKYNWSGTTSVVTDLTTNVAYQLYTITPKGALWIRFLLSGATANSSFDAEVKFVTK